MGAWFTVSYSKWRLFRTRHRYVEFDYLPATKVSTDADEPVVDVGSWMTLHNAPPRPGYQMFEIIRALTFGGCL